MAKKLKAIHPGEVLRVEFLEPLGLNPHKLALALHVPEPGIYEIVREERAISAEMALRLARFFGTSPDFWLNLQARHELEVARDKEQARVDREVQPMKTAVV